jgi:hypothetical protein
VERLTDMRLFKYFKISDHSKANLSDRQVWFSAPNDFNDIDDSDLRLDWQLTDEDVRNEFLFLQQQIYQMALAAKDLSEKPVAMEAALRSQYETILADRGPDGAPDHSGTLRARMTEVLAFRRQTIGISCFSQDNLNRLLWSYYADGDRGMCIEIETDVDARCFQRLEAVHYVNVLPKIKLLTHMLENLITLYTTKSSKWAHEREIRAFQHSRGHCPMEPRCLENCFFGERASPAEVEQIRHIVRDRYGKSVGLFQMIRREDGEREFRPLTD